MKKSLLAGVFTFTILAFLALAFVPPVLMAKDEIVFGIIEPISGPFKDVGDRYVNAAKFAVEQINADGGLLGKKVVTVVEDNSLKPAISTRKAKKLILEDGAKFIMTGTGSHNTLAMARVAEKYKVINLSYGTEAASITGSDFTPYTFRCCLNTDQHSAVLVVYMVKKYPQFKKYYIICQDYAFGRQAAEGFRKKFEQIKPPGARIVGEIFHPIANKDFAPYITAIMASGAEVVFSGNWGVDLQLLMKHGASLGWKVKLADYFLNDPVHIEAVGGQAAIGHVAGDSYMITIDSPKNRAFLKKWAKKYRDAPMPYKWPNLSMGRCYWGVRFMAEAIKKAGTTDAEAVIKAWEGMSYEVPWGTVTMRACDHQMISPGVAAEVMPRSEFYDFPYVGKPTIIPAEDITTPPELTGNPRCK
jgi:branched-chain amino acid transport system substrate-binding protein